MTLPLPPKEYFADGKTFLQGEGPPLGEFFTMRNEKALKLCFPKSVWGERTANPWIRGVASRKSLILEASMPTGCVRLSTCCSVFPTGSFFSMLHHLSIYLFKKKG